MKKTLNRLAWGWLAMWLLISVVMVYRNREYNSNAKQQLAQIQPILEHIKGFKMANERPPSEGELKDWMNVNAITNTFQYITNNNAYPARDSIVFRTADWNKDFAIGMQNIGRVDYYTSWNNVYHTTPLSQSTMILSSLLLIFLGALPFPILWLVNRKH